MKFSTQLAIAWLLCGVLSAPIFMCKSWQPPHEGPMVKKTMKEFIVVANGCVRQCWTSVIDLETMTVHEVSRKSACVGHYKVNQKVKGFEYIYELHNFENKKVGEVKRILLNDLEDCK